MATTRSRLAAASLLLLIVSFSLAAFAGDDAQQNHALIYGTVYGPDNRPVYGVKVKIRPADKKKAKWELMSDHRGEFAQRVPPGPADYIVWADVKTKKGEKPPETKVHIDNVERVDMSLHLTE